MSLMSPLRLPSPMTLTSSTRVASSLARTLVDRLRMLAVTSTPLAAAEGAGPEAEAGGGEAVAAARGSGACGAAPGGAAACGAGGCDAAAGGGAAGGAAAAAG